MAERDLQRIDISTVTDLEALAEEMRRTNEPRILRRANEDIAILAPVTRKKRKRIAVARPFTMDDPLWNIVGIAHSEGPTDVSQNKHKYLAEAYADLHEPKER